MIDQWAAWRHALAGNRLDFGPKGEPPSGFYRQATRQGIEAIAIWRDGEGAIHCRRSIFGNGAKMGADEIDELLATCGHYPISHDLYMAVTKEGKEWPPEYATTLTAQEIKNCVPWTPELGRAKIGKDIEPAENPRAVAGGNNPPKDLTPDQNLAGQVNVMEAAVADWLKSIGGEPRNKAEADTLGNYAVKFADFKTTAEAAHKVEKEPHLIAGREVDAKWFAIRDRAAAVRKRCLDIVGKWIKTEQTKRAEEARKANEEAARLRAEQAKTADVAPPAVEEVKPEPVKVGTARSLSQRERQTWVVTDPAAYAAFLCKMETIPPDLTEVLNKIARRQGAAGITQIPGVTKQTVESVA